MAYDSPNYTVRNEQFPGEAGGGVKSLADATGKAHIIYEYENASDGAISA